MAIIGWVDTETVADDWADAPEDEAVLTSYLRAAHSQCVEYLPPVPQAFTGELMPNYDGSGQDPYRLRLAQILQARALWNSTHAGGGDQFGPDGLRVTVFPMDWTVRNLLRPRRIGRVL